MKVYEKLINYKIVRHYGNIDFTIRNRCGLMLCLKKIKFMTL